MKKAKHIVEEAYKVPEDYFDTLNARIMQNIKAETAKEHKTETPNLKPNSANNYSNHQATISILRWKGAAAACIVVALVISIQGIRHHRNQHSTEPMANYTDDVFSTSEYSEEEQDVTILAASIGTSDIYSYLSGADY